MFFLLVCTPLLFTQQLTQHLLLTVLRTPPYVCTTSSSCTGCWQPCAALARSRRRGRGAIYGGMRKTAAKKVLPASLACVSKKMQPSLRSKLARSRNWIREKGVQYISYPPHPSLYYTYTKVNSFAVRDSKWELWLTALLTVDDAVLVEGTFWRRVKNTELC